MYLQEGHCFTIWSCCSHSWQYPLLGLRLGLVLRLIPMDEFIPQGNALDWLLLGCFPNLFDWDKPSFLLNCNNLVVGLVLAGRGGCLAASFLKRAWKLNIFSCNSLNKIRFSRAWNAKARSLYSSWRPLRILTIKSLASMDEIMRAINSSTCLFIFCMYLVTFSKPLTRLVILNLDLHDPSYRWLWINRGQGCPCFSRCFNSSNEQNYGMRKENQH